MSYSNSNNNNLVFTYFGTTKSKTKHHHHHPHPHRPQYARSNNKKLTTNNEIPSDDLYNILSLPRNELHGHHPRLEIYSKHVKPEDPEIGTIKWTSKIYEGDVLEDNDYDLMRKGRTTSTFKTKYTKMGPWEQGVGPIIVFLHGVPSNRTQYYRIQELLKCHARTVSVDMLGLGESDKPVNLRRKGKTSGADSKGHYRAWTWKIDAQVLEALRQQVLPENARFFLFGDDWGAGGTLKYASMFGKWLIALGEMDPIAFDGYPVSEIQAIGRSAKIQDPEKFMMAMGAFDQTLVQIYKTMVDNPDKVFNQYSLRDLKKTYVDTDYDRNSKYGDLNSAATSMTLRLKFRAIRVLAERASILAPVLLSPKTTVDYTDNNPGDENDYGIDFSKIDMPVLIVWGKEDNMMPETQRYRFVYALQKSEKVQHRRIPDAGHYAGIDQPEIVAEYILNFLVETFGTHVLPQPFFGFTGIWKGDEEQMLNKLMEIRNKKQRF